MIKKADNKTMSKNGTKEKCRRVKEEWLNKKHAEIKKN